MGRSRQGRLQQELAFRASVAAIILAFNEWLSIGSPAAGTTAVRTAALVGLLLITERVDNGGAESLVDI